MAKWTNIGSVDDFPPGCQVCLEPGTQPLMVFNIDGKLIAAANTCPHAGLPVGEGELVGVVLTCPFHGYAFNLETGANVDAPDTETPLTMFPIRQTADGRVTVDLDPNP